MIFPIITLWSYLLQRKPEFWSDQAQNLMQPIPHPNDALDEIWLWLATWSQRYSSESVNWRTNGRRLESHPISSQRAFGSGELKNNRVFLSNHQKKPVVHEKVKHTNKTRYCVYETLCPTPLACPPSFSPGNLLTIFFQLGLLAVKIFDISLLDVFAVQICKGH